MRRCWEWPAGSRKKDRIGCFRRDCRDRWKESWGSTVHSDNYRDPIPHRTGDSATVPGHPGSRRNRGISATDRSLVASHWFPREAEARLQSGLVELDADSPIRSNANRATPDARAAFWDEPLQARDIEIRLPETPRGPLLFSVRNPDVLYLRGMLQKPAAFSLLPVEPI